MRSSQIFSVCGLPEVRIKKALRENGGSDRYSVELLGLDVFDPVTMETRLCFHVSQAFFPRTSAWEGDCREGH
jgi:adenine-specific DNA-methyltransferase